MRGPWLLLCPLFITIFNVFYSEEMGRHHLAHNTLGMQEDGRLSGYSAWKSGNSPRLKAFQERSAVKGVLTYNGVLLRNLKSLLRPWWSAFSLSFWMPALYYLLRSSQGSQWNLFKCLQSHQPTRPAPWSHAQKLQDVKCRWHSFIASGAQDPPASPDPSPGLFMTYNYSNVCGFY